MTAAGPQVKEIQPLNFHESPVNQEVITEHDDRSDNEMGDGFRGNKWFAFFLNLRHEVSISLSRLKIAQWTPGYRQTDANQ